MKIKAIRYAGKADVFNMEVADTHDYAIENGLIVHNCRYVIMLTKPKIKLPVNIQKYRRVSPLGITDRKEDDNDKGKVLSLPEIVIGG